LFCATKSSGSPPRLTVQAGYDGRPNELVVNGQPYTIEMGRQPKIVVENGLRVVDQLKPSPD
jgi:hypothetical protein